MPDEFWTLSLTKDWLDGSLRPLFPYVGTVSRQPWRQLQQYPHRNHQGLYTTELIHRSKLWKTKAAVSLDTVEWVVWLNTLRLLDPNGYVPPAEAEANCCRRLAEQLVAQMA